MFQAFYLTAIIFGLSPFAHIQASSDPMIPKEIDLSIRDTAKLPRKTPATVKASFSPFTGRVSGEKVHVRLHPDLDSAIISKLSHKEYISVIAQEGDFYCIEPGDSIKAYIFRSFVLDGIVEGNRVNIRLKPDLEAPIIAHANSGDRVEGVICPNNRKWLKITLPPSTRFYVSKEYIDYAGDPELRAELAKRKVAVEQLLQEADEYARGALCHSFEEIDFKQLKQGYLTVIQEYSDFPDQLQLAKQALAHIQEQYLQKRISYLEAKAALVDPSSKASTVVHRHSPLQLQTWEAIEEGLYITWAKMNENQPIDAFYQEQRLIATCITGMLEPFTSSVHHKPGDFILKKGNLPIAYVYSTSVDLKSYVGKQVTLLGSPRPNNNFAFPAYFVHDVQ